MTPTDVVTPVLCHAEARPDHPAFVFGDRTLTYRGLADQSRRLASALLSAGLRRGDRVAVLSPNRPEIFSVYLGLAMIGAAIVPVNAEFAADEIRYILDHSQARMVIRADALAAQVAEASEGLAGHPQVEDFDTFLARAAGFAPYDGPQLGSGQDLVLLCYTSGTTSKPKGVAATHANELASALAYGGMMAITPADRELVTLPLSFSYGFHAATYVALLSGATVLLAPRFHPRLALEAIEALRPTVFLGVPTMYAMMADVARKEGRRPDLSSLRLTASSGAALNDQLLADCRDHLGIEVRPYYAMTEVRPIFSFDLRHGAMPPPGSVGRLIAPTEVRLVDEAGQDAGDGQVGELWVRGPSFSGAYYKDPERTAQAMVEGWFLTGDLASRDAEGNYFIVGRTRDQIISGGAKIAPIEVEDILLAHPGIAAAAVVGQPDPVFGQVVKAVIVKADPALTAEEVRAHCEGRIADYKVPRVVAFMEALPMAPSGKILKTALV
ncbi:long-chain fatty acid--CoA ligase [Rhodobacter sp. SGA-6-6]|uniref:class I adenylate-forming enzyme family protein n=1 Tax=Rhodobacter sp. SGA-6-6 TaxID=2710882 RepID=UPI0013EB8ABC|nr:AMP-binding protein [Rhodobacter sp. SGA-6-6]NGM47082.1 long-chain fatty acid--CoA ligase [Rhodobacter sp. SGA-6-6]